jgi:hypothetical protein
MLIFYGGGFRAEMPIRDLKRKILEREKNPLVQA